MLRVSPSKANVFPIWRDAGGALVWLLLVALSEKKIFYFHLTPFSNRKAKLKPARSVKEICTVSNVRDHLL